LYHEFYGLRKYFRKQSLISSKTKASPKAGFGRLKCLAVERNFEEERIQFRFSVLMEAEEVEGDGSDRPK
jgi:hypothetical protein